MEQKELTRTLTEQGFKRLTAETRFGTYMSTNRSSLIAQQVSNRSSADWKKAQIVIINEDRDNTIELTYCLNGWKTMAEPGQFLAIHEQDDWYYYTYLGEAVSFEEMISYKASNAGRQNAANNETSRQIIFYGAPGTGKSHEVKRITGECDDEGRDNVFRTTFHPDTDYATFVGCYKPTMKDTGQIRKVGDKTEKVEEINYEFVPQTFTDAYVYAYKHPDTVTYLVIEEINRGNCAQVFGDLFQLLDRKEDGTSEYRIKADKDLAKHLISEGVASGEAQDVKLCLPANLHILATMNTSDQSLFPMDSAFKRRWDWEYVPISYTEEKSSAFEIEIGGEKYQWVKFIEAANKRILALTDSEDKMMGNFFIKSSVDERQFKSKVMFYLWNEVLRDEVGNQKYFFYGKNCNTDATFTFKDLYEDGATETLQGFMRYLGIEA